MNHAPALASVSQRPTVTDAIKINPARFALFVNVFLRKPAAESPRHRAEKAVWSRRALKIAA